MNRSTGFERALEAARAAALNHRHAFVGTEHLLAGLLDDPSGLAATLVSQAGLDATQLRAGVLSGLRKAAKGQTTSAESLTLSRLAQRAIDEAVARARDAGATEVTERELLGAVVAEPRGRIAQVLGADSTAHRALAGLLGTPEGEAGPVPTASRAETETETETRGGKRRRDKGKADRQPDRTVDRRAAEPVEASTPTPAAPVAEPPRPPRRVVVPRDPPRRWGLLLLVFIPISVVLAWRGAAPVMVFIASCVAILPLAGLMGDATEALAHRFGPTIGGLLNATFGNAAELIIAVMALRAGLVDLVKASITGSILGNLLLILGLSCLAGGLGRTTVRFSRTNAGMSAAMLALAVVGLVFPAVFHAVHREPDALAELHLSEVVAGILIVTYGLSLVFSLKTHRALFSPSASDHGSSDSPEWPMGFAVGVLALATLGVVVESELLVRTVEGATETLGLSEAFLGLIVIPLVGNAAEHATAVVVARKGKMDLAFQIALGSSTQIALLVAPLLVFVGLGLGTDMNLVFSAFEVVALAVTTVLVAIITLDGETHWFEGVQLLAVYGLLAAAAFFI
ncbi:MAG: calcium/proton exchanger [Gemmatimonadales bacterium]